MLTLLRRVRELPGVETATAAEALMAMTAAKVALAILPFRWIAPRLGAHMAEGRPAIGEVDRQTVLRVKRAIRRAAKHTPWECSCLVRAAAGKRMLDRRRVAATLFLGLAKDGEKETGLKAHAWLRSGDVILTGHEDVDVVKFTVISTFS